MKTRSLMTCSLYGSGGKGALHSGGTPHSFHPKACSIVILHPTSRQKSILALLGRPILSYCTSVAARGRYNSACFFVLYLLSSYELRLWCASRRYSDQ